MEPNPNRVQSVATAKLRVLIVDDMQQVRQELSRLLPLLGPITVVGEAANGLDAVRQVQALRPEVVIMDLAMPILDGCEAARRIKTLDPHCRIIALTIHAGEPERQQALQAGMADVVVKGAPLEELLRAIGT
jgi:two-component system, NarL family, response regulator NreC